VQRGGRICLWRKSRGYSPRRREKFLMRKTDKIKQNPFERSQPVTQDFFNIPLLGMVRPSMSPLSTEDYNLSELVSNFQNTDQYSITLEVLDDAMYKAGIIKGDYLTIDLQSRLLDGDIIVVKLGERFFIRRFYLQQHFVRLETADEYPSSLVIEDNTPGFQIIGKVTSLSRQF
jgi:SOS-response transcriptional repressor LexA